MFDEIPEDKVKSYPCECGGRNTKTNHNKWECDSCDFSAIETGNDYGM